MKRKTLFAALLSLSLMALPQGASADAIRVTVDGSPLNMDVPPIIQNDRVLTPFRAIAEKLGAKVSYDDVTQKVTAVKDNTELSFIIGQNSITINGQNKPLDVAPAIVNDRVLLPARAFAESLGANVEWHDNTVIIGSRPDEAQAWLIKSTEAIAKLNSYTFEGTMNFQMSGDDLPDGTMKTAMKFAGSYAKPFSMLMTMTMDAPKPNGAPADQIVMDALFLNGKYYIKPSGKMAAAMGSADQWLDTGVEIPADLLKAVTDMQSPEEAVKSIKTFGLKAVSGGDKVINGVTYKVIQVRLNQNILPMLQQLNSTLAAPGAENLSFNYFYTYYINPETALTDFMDLNGSSSMTVEGKTITVALKGSMIMKDYDKAFTFPDVSQAIPLPKTPAAVR